MSLEINEKKLKDMNFEEVIELIKENDLRVREYQDVSKAKLILVAAEKLKESGYPILEIKDVILERLGVSVTRPYLLRILPDEYKKATKIAGGKKAAEVVKQKQAITNAGASTVLEPPIVTHESDGEDAYHEGYDANTKAERHSLPDIQPELESERMSDEDEKGFISLHEEMTKQNYSHEYVQSLEEQVKALKGELPYKDCLATMKVVKVDKVTENRMLNASKAAKTHVYLVIDIRSNEIREIFTDTEYQKQFKTKQKSKKGQA